MEIFIRKSKCDSSSRKDKVYWWGLLSNPNVIQLLCDIDYDKMKENMRLFADELLAKTFHPDRLERICKMYNIELEDYVERL